MLEIYDRAHLPEVFHGLGPVYHAAAGGDDRAVGLYRGVDSLFHPPEALYALAVYYLPEQPALTRLDEQVGIYEI